MKPRHTHTHTNTDTHTYAHKSRPPCTLTETTHTHTHTHTHPELIYDFRTDSRKKMKGGRKYLVRKTTKQEKVNQYNHSLCVESIK